jgi:hypothetical protein
MQMIIRNSGNLDAYFDFKPQLKDSIAPGALDINSWSVNFKGGSFPGEGSTCGATLAPGATCTIIMTADTSTAGDGQVTLLLPIRDDSGVGIFEIIARATVM